MALQQPMDVWLDQLASDAPAPGGGAAAALGGALAAALVSMVARFTTGRPAYAAVDAEARAILAESERLRADLTTAVAADADAYQAVADAYRLPKGDDAERAARTAAIQAALTTATEVPLTIAEQAGELLALAQRVAAIGNRSVLTDAGAAALLARSAQRAALLNVATNLTTLRDPNRRGAFASRMAASERDAEATVAATLASVDPGAHA